MTFEEILRAALNKGATDIHLKAGVMPVIRKNGMLRPMGTSTPPMTAEQIEQMVYSILDSKQRDHLEKHRELDLGYGVKNLGRFRVSIFRQRGTLRVVVRNIPFKVPGFDELNLPPILSKIAHM